jgi:hypothetical protein
MPESTVPRTKRDGLIVVSDSGAANDYTVSCEPGDFNYAAPGHSILRLLDRGEHKTPRRQDAQVTTLGFSVILTDIGDPTNTYATLPDICEYERAGTFVNGSWTSTFGTTSDVFGVDVTYTVDGSAFGEADKDLLFDDVSLRGSFAEGDPSAYTATGEASILAPVLS